MTMLIQHSHVAITWSRNPVPLPSCEMGSWRSLRRGPYAWGLTTNPYKAVIDG